MEYSPEIAVLHAAFALVEKESKSQSTDTLLLHQKACTSSRTFLLISNALSEIVSLHNKATQTFCEKKLLKLLYHKAFHKMGEDVTDVEASLEELLKINEFKSVCHPVPAFHPSFFFDLLKEMGWTSQLTEALSVSHLPASLNCVQSCLDYICSEPAAPFDLQLFCTNLNFVVSCFMAEILQASQTGRQLLLRASEIQADNSLPPGGLQQLPCWEHKRVDKKSLQTIVNMLLQLLETAHRRVFTQETLKAVTLIKKEIKKKDFDLKRVLCCSLSCVALIGVISLSSCAVPELILKLSSLFVDEDDNGRENSKEESSLQQTSSNVTDKTSSSSSSVCEEIDIQQHLLQSLRHLTCKKACLDCISNIFSPQNKDSDQDHVNLASALGSLLELEFQLPAFRFPVKMADALRELCQLTCTTKQDKEEEEGGLPGKDVQDSILLLQAVVQKREEEAERRRQHPELDEVMERVQKRLPRWKRCLDFGLAQRDISGWWYAGFLDLLRGNPGLLHRESDVQHLLWVLMGAVNMLPERKDDSNIFKMAQLIKSVFSRLPLTVQDKIIQDYYLSSEMENLPLVDKFDQALMITFNKLSAKSTPEDVRAALPLALHDPMAFTDHAVGVAVSNAGQVPLVVQVLQQMPAVCRSVHPQKHAGVTLLCHCVHAVLCSHQLDADEQKNFISLVSSLVQIFEDGKQAALLSPVEFLKTSVFPFLTFSTLPETDLSLELALKLLIGVLDATLSVGSTDWLEELNLAALVVCCGEFLNECVELTTSAGEVDLRVRIKSLVLTVLGVLLKHISAANRCFEDKDLDWMGEKCAVLDWTVSAYLAEFLTKSSEAQNNQLLRHFAGECAREVESHPVGLLRLAAISDAAEREVVQLVQNSAVAVLLPETAVLSSVYMLLPQLLTSEVRRVVRVLSVLRRAGCVDLDFRRLYTEPCTDADFGDVQADLCTSQILMDAALLLTQDAALRSSQNVCHYLAQVLVAALQEILQQVSIERDSSKSVLFVYEMIFCHVAVIMSAAPEVMLEPLFVVLLDLLTKDPLDLDILMQGIRLIPREAMQEALMKRLEKSSVD